MTDLARKPVTTLAELDQLDGAEVIEGYMDAKDGITVVGDNRSKSYWHGWRNGMADSGQMPIDEAQRKLAHEVVKSWRAN